MTHADLAELLRDPSDIADFLIAFGEQSLTATDARQRALEVLKGLKPTQAVGILFEFARNFARMAKEVVDFCQTQGVALNGQIQLSDDKLTLNLSSLETTWAFAGPADDLETLEARSEALAAALADTASRLRADDLIQTFKEERITSFGRALRDDPVTSGIWREIDGAVDEVRHKGFSTADVHSLELATEAIEQAASALGAAPLSVSAANALQDLQYQLTIISTQARANRLNRDGKATPWLAALTDEILLVVGQLRNLAYEFSEGQRVERGLHDFLRTEFWPARWRIYELWLLTRLLKTVEAVGTQFQLLSISNGVWSVRYGHAKEPVAIATFPIGELEVYYQYWRENADSADMPDLVILAPGAGAVVVLDPKHGSTYTRPKVQKVLQRYARNLKADVTAVVNYFPMAAYTFDRVLSPGGPPIRSWILASDVAPGTNNSRRLELCIEEALRARGYHAPSEPKTVPAVVSGRRVPAIDLLYWASKEREVDEPPGLWLSVSDGTTTLVRGTSSKDFVGTVGIEASPDGNTVVVLRQPDVELFRPKRTPQTIAALTSSFFNPSIGWASDGKYFILPLDHDHLFDRDGNDRGALPEKAEAIGWDVQGHTLYCLIQEDEDKNAYQLALFSPEIGILWKKDLSTQGTRFSSTDRKRWRVQPDFSAEGVTVYLGEREILRVQPDGSITRERQIPIGVSPGRQYALTAGPYSRYQRRLLQLQTKSGSILPLVRYTGQLPRQVKWTTDGNRLAFLTEYHREERPRLFSVRPGERFARAVSLPGQEPSAFAWVRSDVFA